MMRSSKVCQRILIDERRREERKREEEILEVPDEDAHGGRAIEAGSSGRRGLRQDKSRLSRMRGSCATLG